MTPTIRSLAHIEEVGGLVTEAANEGFGFLGRLVREWRDGSNRFDAQGEILLVAEVGREVVAVGGLNVDPYASDPAVGRIRHFYVSPAVRRRGIGSLLLADIVLRAEGIFPVLRLRTDDPEAALFYQACGFGPVLGEDACTHYRAAAVA